MPKCFQRPQRKCPFLVLSSARLQWYSSQHAEESHFCLAELSSWRGAHLDTSKHAALVAGMLVSTLHHEGSCGKAGSSRWEKAS